MVFKSPTQPLCRYCGKKIAKRTMTVQFGRAPEGRPGLKSDYWDQKPDFPHSKEEAQRLINQKIVSIRWERDGYWAEKHGQPFIDQVGVWDGESYVDQFFCNGEHARYFGYLMAETSGRATNKYNEALAKLNKEVEHGS